MGRFYAIDEHQCGIRSHPSSRTCFAAVFVHDADEFVPSKSGKTFASINPSTAEKICDVSEGFAEDIDAAAEAAAAAFRRGSAWRTMDASARGALLFKLADLLERDREQVAKIEALDNGKPFAMANGVDLHLAIKCFRYYAGWADKVYGKTIPMDGPVSATAGASI